MLKIYVRKRCLLRKHSNLLPAGVATERHDPQGNLSHRPETSYGELTQPVSDWTTVPNAGHRVRTHANARQGQLLPLCHHSVIALMQSCHQLTLFSMIHIATTTRCWSSAALDQTKERYRMEPQYETDMAQLPPSNDLRHPRFLIVDKAART